MLCFHSLPFAPFAPHTLSPLAPTEAVVTLKPSITLPSLPFAPLDLPCPSPLVPQRWWGPQNLVYNMLCSPLLPHPLPPTEVEGTLKPSIQYALLPFTPFAQWPLSTPCSHRGGGDPKTLVHNMLHSLSLPLPLPPQRWWGPYNLVYYMLCSPSLPFAPSPLALTKVVRTLKLSIIYPCSPLPPEVVGTLKPNITPLLYLTPLDPLTPNSPLATPSVDMSTTKGAKGSKGG